MILRLDGLFLKKKKAEHILAKVNICHIECYVRSQADYGNSCVRIDYSLQIKVVVGTMATDLLDGLVWLTNTD